MVLLQRLLALVTGGHGWVSGGGGGATAAMMAAAAMMAVGHVTHAEVLLLLLP